MFKPIMNAMAFQPQPIDPEQDISTVQAFGRNFEFIPWSCQEHKQLRTFVGYIGLDERRKNQTIVLYSYGNQENSHSNESVVDKLTKISKQTGFCFVVYDYPGYGPFAKINGLGADGWSDRLIRLVWQKLPEGVPIPSEDGANMAIETVFHYLTKTRFPEPGRRFMLWGRSLGTVPTCHLLTDICNRKRISRVVLEMPLSSALRVKLWGCHIPYLDQFDNIDSLQQLLREHAKLPPMYLLHGELDTLIVPKQVQLLFELVSQLTETPELARKECIKGCDHNGMEEHDYQRLVQWMS
jgi:hypothetical protein